MKLFDTHCHLNSNELYNDVENVIKRAKENSVTRILVVGYNLKTSFLAVELANKYDNVYASVGFHPTEINVSEEDFTKVMSLLKDEKVVALGEIGLDYHWVKEKDQQEKQKQYFVKQINIANHYKKPICVHDRESFADCLEILKNNPPLYGGVMHCYSGPSDKINELIKLGMYISFGGPVTFLNGKKPKESAIATPLDKLLIETDSPYLSPHPFRGKINEPANVLLVAQEIARLKGISLEELGEITYSNGNKLFHIEKI